MSAQFIGDQEDVHQWSSMEFHSTRTLPPWPSPITKRTNFLPHTRQHGNPGGRDKKHGARDLSIFWPANTQLMPFKPCHGPIGRTKCCTYSKPDLRPGGMQNANRKVQNNNRSPRILIPHQGTIFGVSSRVVVDLTRSDSAT